jgi:hypothetical protein
MEVAGGERATGHPIDQYHVVVSGRERLLVLVLEGQEHGRLGEYESKVGC